ncbi:nucleotidyltransferase domain-containing protein [Plantactinospora sp. S1510]|uniref:Nucleotidyltransferase domain-containing protein n=1 Tax=Plantactinospora alkalitolerans TaxID=2789879 RepID=A0ABS0GVG8_9ACTN|nr:nucleotidyltransferase domain-containing protein [Plantactinospora alkalitolerans]MBF9129924.1 nucleotidyltransferase domain-containing protein [Plantactinospora alkalitolerans]
MILDEQYLQWLLDQTLAVVDVPSGAGVVLEGSIAEGFGNASSDIDLLLLYDDEHEYPTMPSILFVDGRRVEVRTRSLRQAREQAELVTRLASRGGAGLPRIPVDLLNRCQRLSRSFPLRGHDVVDRAHRALPADQLPGIVAPWFAHHARQAMRQVVALDAMRQTVEAAAWTRIALTQAAKAWVAAHGETYVESKWLSQQFDRIGEDSAEFAERYWSLTRKGTDDGTMRPGTTQQSARVMAAAELVDDFGVAGCTADSGMIDVIGTPAVTTWAIGTQLHVIRDRRDVFVLSPQAAAVWRSVVAPMPLNDLLRCGGSDPAVVGAIVAEFYRIGLLRLRWRNGAAITIAQPYGAEQPSTPIPSTSLPILGIHGAVRPDDDPPIVALLPLPAQRFAAAGMAHVWSNIMVDNAREDLTGAQANQQWRVAETAGRRMLISACRALLSAYGVSPLPPDSGLIPRLGQLRVIPDELAKAADAIDDSITSADSPASVAAVANSLDEFIRRVREGTGASLFPASFTSADAWDRTIQIGHDWIRVGAYLDSDFPIEEARDVFTTGGVQPHLSGATDVHRA